MPTGTPAGPIESPSAFYFKMVVDGLANSDQSFQEVGGIESELQVEEVVEGGENRFVHRLPTAVKHPALILKRGTASVNSPLVGWCRSVLESGLAAPITPKQIRLYLLDPDGKPLRGWSFVDAYPVKWEIASLDGTNGQVAIETIELSYSTSKALD
jgi:phage tail-like protein